MRITKTQSSITIHASVIDFLVRRAVPPAKTVLFDRTRGTVTVRSGFTAGRIRTIPYGQVRKIQHRIAAPILRVDLDAGHAYYRSVSAASEILMELRDSSTVAIFAEVYDQGGDSRAIREGIRRIQELVDEVSRITEKPMAIDFEEVECTFDAAERKLRFSGDLLPADLKGHSLRFDEIDRLEVVEAERGYYSFTVHPRWGRGIRTTEGYDSTNYLSDTAAMIAEKSNLFCRNLGKKPPDSSSRDVPNVPIRPGGWRRDRPPLRDALPPGPFRASARFRR